jgi:hypothetical protein
LWDLDQPARADRSGSLAGLIVAANQSTFVICARALRGAGKLVWCLGDGSDLDSYDTDVGRFGGSAG